MVTLGVKKEFSGLEIEGGLVKFVQAEDYPAYRRITKLIVKHLPAETEENVISALRDIVSELKGRIGHLTFCLPRHKVTVRFLRFPSLKEKEIEQMVALQSIRELPFHKEEIVSDYLITEQTADGYSKVALVIAQKSLINNCLNILSMVHLEPGRITFSTEAALNWYRQAFKKEQAPASLALVDLNQDDSDIVIFNHGCLDFTRGLSFGVRQLQNDSSAREKLAQEFRRTVAGYRRLEKTREVERLLLAQSSQLTEELGAFLKQEFNLIGDAVSPFKNINYQKDIFASQYKLESSLLRLIGLVLRAEGREVNLLPGPLREKKTWQLRRKETVRLLILGLSVILLSGLIFVKKFSDQHQRLKFLNGEVARTSSAAIEVRDMLKTIELIQSRRRIAGAGADVLRELHVLTPANIAFSALEYLEEDKRLTIEGASEDMAGIFQFVNTLEKSQYFKNVQVKYAREKESKDAGMIYFEIECSLEK